MSSADGLRHIILNGEIYNYLELRAELASMGHVFRTRSDTEVLLEAWGAWGAGALDRVVGMYAFAVLDESKQTLVLARDQFAIKPLYYTLVRGQLAFASEIPPLLSLPGVGRAVDPGPLADFLSRGVNNHAGHTMFADVRELPGAHFALAIPAVPRERAAPLLQAVRNGQALPRPRAFEAWRLVTLAARSRAFGVTFD
jgi:asparagine synthase (glutamine-hydrolysing)